MLVNKIRSVESMAEPWVIALLGKTPVPCIVDSGAVISIMDYEVYVKLKGENRVIAERRVNKTCKSASGNSMSISLKALLQVNILGFSWKHHFYIMNRAVVPVLIGMDFILKTKMELYLWKGKFSFAFNSEREGNFVPREVIYPNLVGYLDEEMRERELILGEISPPGDLGRFSHMIARYPRLFSEEVGTIRGRSCNIELKDNLPVRSPPYQVPPPKLAILRSHVQDLLVKGIIRPSKSDYASPAFLVPKPNGKHRLVVNYQKLNEKVQFDCFPLPTIESALQHLSGAKVFSVIDLNMAYHQIPLTAKSRRCTAFITPFGLYEFNKLPMGISIGSQVLSREIDHIFSDVKYKYLLTFADDLLVYSKNESEHETHLSEVFNRLEEAGFTVNKDKITLGASKIKFLGHILSERGVGPDPKYIQTVMEYPTPKSVKQVKRFVGMAGFYSKFIPNYAAMASPLNKFKCKGEKFKWTEEHGKAFDSIKSALCRAPTLHLPDFSGEFVLQCDASDVAISAVLNQKLDSGLVPIGYSSRKLSVLEAKYSIYERETLAVIYGCERFRSYLEHKEFTVHSDSEAVTWLRKHPRHTGRIGRWALRLAPFKFKIVHIRGSSNVVADCLSRMFSAERNLDTNMEETDRDVWDPPRLLSQEPCEVAPIRVLEELPASFESLSEHQKADVECREIYNKIRQGNNGTCGYIIKRGLVMFKPQAKAKERVLIPRALRPMILHYFHDSNMGIHLGIRRTWYKIKKNYYWPKQYYDIRKYVISCEVCQRIKPSRNAQVGLHSATVAERPMQRLYIDFTGPYIRSAQGNTVLLSVCDGFSRFVWLFPMRNASSKLVVKALQNNIFGAFGVPESIVSDNASVFHSKEYKDCCFKWGIKAIYMSPFFPKGSLCERHHRNLKAALTAYHHKEHNQWDRNLHFIQFGFNTAWHEATQSTPCKLFLGRDLQDPLGLNWEVPVNVPGPPENIDIEWREAIDHMVQARNRVATKYNRGRVPHQFKIGDLVLVKLFPKSSRIMGKTAKLELKWSLPMKISRFLTPVTVELSHSETGNIIRKAHVSQIKRYFPPVSDHVEL